MQIGVIDQGNMCLDLIIVDDKVLAKFGKDEDSQIMNFLFGFCGYSSNDISWITSDDDHPIAVNTLEPKDFNDGDPEAWLEGEGREWLDEDDDEDDFSDIHGSEINLGDTVVWHDEAGQNEDGSMIEFEVVEDNGDGYFNLRTLTDKEPFPERWAWHNELEVI